MKIIYFTILNYNYDDKYNVKVIHIYIYGFPLKIAEKKGTIYSIKIPLTDTGHSYVNRPCIASMKKIKAAMRQNNGAGAIKKELASFVCWPISLQLFLS